MRLVVTLSLAVGFSLGVAGCGFQPLYGQREGQPSVPEQLSRVRIGEIRAQVPETLRTFRDFPVENSRSAQILRNYLLDELSPRGAATRTDYVLDIRLFEPRTNAVIDRSDTTVRYGYSVTAYYTLRDSRGNIVLNSAAGSSTTFEASTSEFATISSQRDARDRIMQAISIDIRNGLAVYFVSPPRTSSP